MGAAQRSTLGNTFKAKPQNYRQLRPRIAPPKKMGFLTEHTKVRAAAGSSTRIETSKWVS
jgi:hypothetical protein